MNKYTKEQEEKYGVINDILMYLWNVDFYTFIQESKGSQSCGNLVTFR